MEGANVLVQYNIPISFADQLSPLLRNIFPDSEIAKSFAAASTKKICIINGALAPSFKRSLVDSIKTHPFSIAIDGTNVSGTEKMKPINVRVFDPNEGRIRTQFLDMCLTKGIAYL